MRYSYVVELLLSAYSCNVIILTNLSFIYYFFFVIFTLSTNDFVNKSLVLKFALKQYLNFFQIYISDFSLHVLYLKRFCIHQTRYET
jgi:hypothetical protein